jgi:hypothetical protein
MQWVEQVRGKEVEQQVMECVKKGQEGWTESEGLVLWEGQIYVPKIDDLRAEILKAHHDSPIAGHPG